MIHALDVALSQLGIAEATGRNDGIPAERYMRGDRLAWCAGFVLYCFDVSDDPDLWDDDGQEDDADEKLYWHMRAVKIMRTRLDHLGLLIGPGVVPAPNDIAFFNSRGDSDAGSGWHVAIVEEVVIRRHGPRPVPRFGYTVEIRTVEGNVADSVARRRHYLGDPRLIGFARSCPTPLVYASRVRFL